MESKKVPGLEKLLIFQETCQISHNLHLCCMQKGTIFLPNFNFPGMSFPNSTFFPTMDKGWPGLKLMALHRPLYKVSFHGGPSRGTGLLKEVPSSAHCAIDHGWWKGKEVNPPGHAPNHGWWKWKEVNTIPAMCPWPWTMEEEVKVYSIGNNGNLDKFWITKLCRKFTSDLWQQKCNFHNLLEPHQKLSNELDGDGWGQNKIYQSYSEGDILAQQFVHQS